jgi:hypothetical protein
MSMQFLFILKSEQWLQSRVWKLNENTADKVLSLIKITCQKSYFRDSKFVKRNLMLLFGVTLLFGDENNRKYYIYSIVSQQKGCDPLLDQSH